MGRFDGCLLASDIDGTLQDSGYINPRNREKIKYFVKEGGKFCLCTGRSIGAITAVLKEIGVTDYSVVANGCMIYDNKENKILYQDFLPENERFTVKTVFEQMPDIGIEIHSEGEVYTLRRSFQLDCHQHYEGLPTDMLDFETLLDYNWNKVVFALDEEGDYKRLKELTQSEVRECDFLTTIAVIDDIKRHYYEQLPKGVSKLSALKRLCELAGVKKGGLFAIGDYYNDLDMIKNADISAATADTPDDIKQYADFIAGSCEDGAVADFIDYLINISN